VLLSNLVMQECSDLQNSLHTLIYVNRSRSGNGCSLLSLQQLQELEKQHQLAQQQQLQKQNQQAVTKYTEQ
jgi:hypothetical protein